MRSSCIGERGAGFDAKTRRLVVKGSDDETMHATLNESERLPGRHRLRLRARETIDRPRRKPDGNDALHHSTPQAWQVERHFPDAPCNVRGQSKISLSPVP